MDYRPNGVEKPNTAEGVRTDEDSSTEFAKQRGDFEVTLRDLAADFRGDDNDREHDDQLCRSM